VTHLTINKKIRITYISHFNKLTESNVHDNYGNKKRKSDRN